MFLKRLLAASLAATLALAARQLGAPRFDSGYATPIWQRERERLAAAWTNASTQPATIAARRFAAAVYGSHAYGAEATPDTLARITVADTVGAGDTFWGNTLADWALQPAGAAERVNNTLDLSMKAAAINCTRQGCQPPTRAEVLAF